MTGIINCPNCGIKLEKTTLRNWCPNCGWQEFVTEEKDKKEMGGYIG